MKQKVIVKVSIADEKSRKKAMKTVVGQSGVVSVNLQEKDKNQIEVVGEGIDSVVLTMLLRKSLGFAELVSVSPIPVPEKKEGGGGGGGDKAKGGGDTKNSGNQVISFQQPPPVYYYYPYNGYGYVDIRNDDPTSCNIM